jgi:hypothetical protein
VLIMTKAQDADEVAAYAVNHLFGLHEDSPLRECAHCELAALRKARGDQRDVQNFLTELLGAIFPRGLDTTGIAEVAEKLTPYICAQLTASGWDEAERIACDIAIHRGPPYLGALVPSPEVMSAYMVCIEIARKGMY